LSGFRITFSNGTNFGLLSPGPKNKGGPILGRTLHYQLCWGVCMWGLGPSSAFPFSSIPGPCIVYSFGCDSNPSFKLGFGYIHSYKQSQWADSKYMKFEILLL
jgi:hypothetical protein